MKKTIKAQWVGEFGHELFCFQASMRKLSKDNDVEITCFKGNEFLYKDFATKITSIKKPKGYEPDSHLDRSGVNYGNKDYNIPPNTQVRRMDDLNLLTNQTWVKFGELTDKSTNIIFHVRDTSKNNCGHWNWSKENWNLLYDKLTNLGYSITCIGTTSMSYCLDGCSDYRDKPIEDTVTLLRNAKVIIGESSGPMHLATLCGLPQIVWSGNKRTKSRYEKLWNPFNVKVNHLLTFNPTTDEILKLIETY